MKKFIYPLLLASFSFASYAQTGAEVIELPFSFITNDGCGDYIVSGVVTLIFTENGYVAIHEGTATEEATGETIALHTNVSEHSNQNSFTTTLTIVYQSNAIIHLTFHANVTGQGINTEFRSRVNCSL